jgi:hypothetical protein
MTAEGLTPAERSNFRHLYADVFWFGVLAGSLMAFMTVFAARQGASSFHLGLISAGPGIVNLALSLPAGRWLEGRSNVSVSYWTSVAGRLGYLVLIPLPALFGEQVQIWVLILVTLLISVPGTILAIAFNAMFADLVAPAWRAMVVARRNVLLAVSMIITSLACGQILDRLPFPLNYQFVFALGVLGALMSSYHLGRLRFTGAIPNRIGKPILDFARPGLFRFADSFRMPAGLRYLTRGSGKPLLRLDVLRGPFGLFMLSYLAFYTFQYLPIPIFPIFFVRELNLTDGQISLGSALFFVSMMLTSFTVTALTNRLRHRGVLVLGAFLYGLYPMVNTLARDVSLYMLASLIGGVMWALTNAGLLNRLMERVPEDDRPAHMAIHNLVLNFGILVGSLSGPVLVEWLGIRSMLWWSAGLRFLAAIIFLFFA